MLALLCLVHKSHAFHNTVSGRLRLPDLIIAGGSQGRDRPDLDASLVDKTLLKGADAITRYAKLTATVGLSSGVKLVESSAITVLSENGKSAGYLYAFYDKMEPLRSLKASIYDSRGKLIKDVREYEFQDYSYEDGFSMFADQRYKLYVPAIAEYPYTVVFEVESSIKNSLYLPSWRPQSEEGLAIEHCSFELHIKKDISLKFHQQDISTPVLQTVADNEKIYTWLIDHKAAYKIEPYGPSGEIYAPHVFLAADNFRIDNMTGSLQDWKSYGQFEYDNFLKDAAVLPQNTIDEVLALTAKSKEDKEKARLVYQYMQQKTHYVGVQIGIGGIKTETARNVDLKGYGDCKGLVNYTRALMQVCGIKALYAEVYAGNTPRRVFSDFAGLHFSNHVILCLPFKADTCWLECTSQKIPFNYEGSFTDNRAAILITPEGGKLVHTHRYADAENKQVQTGQFRLSADGHLSGILETRFSGLNYEDRDGIDELTQEKQVEALKRIYAINRLEISSCSFHYLKFNDPLLTEKIDLTIQDFAPGDSTSLSLPMNPFGETERISTSRRKRINPVIVLRGTTIRNNIRYEIPKGFKPESFPDMKVNSEFGDYAVSSTYENNIINCQTLINLRSGRWDASKFEEFVNFYQQLNSVKELALILKKSN